MSMNFSFDHLRSAFQGDHRGRPEPEQPFRVLVIGDFSGRTSRGLIEPLSGRKIHSVDIDSFDDIITSMSIRLSLGPGSPRAMGMGFRNLEDFHPDALFARVEVFEALRAIRARLLNPKTSALAAQEIRAWTPGQESSSIIEPKPGEAPATPQSEFEALLGSGRLPSSPKNHIDALIRDLVSPYIVPSAEPDFPQLAATIDHAIGDVMRDILHDRAFQALERNWTILHELMTRLELGEELTLSVLDASRDELCEDLFSAEGTGLTAALVDSPRRTAGGSAWSLICLLEEFGCSVDDARLAGALAMAAWAAGAPLLASASPTLVGVGSIVENSKPEHWTQAVETDSAQAWELVRSLRESQALGLTLPRVLLRQPYNQRTNPIESFEFDECPDDAGHETLLWGHASLCTTLVLARAFTERGWMLDIEAGGNVESLPVVVRGTGRDKQAVPCAEVYLTDTASQRLLERGLIPVLSIQHRDAVRIPRVCSIHGGALAAAWA